MNEIFISYRRDDTKNWAGPLYRELRANFGDESVFMDTLPGRIPWGADWQKKLASALDGCNVLLVLIGPLWASCKRSDGRRRLHVDDDWVRREIATALRRGIPVLPVVFEGAPPPGEDDLPQELKDLGFANCQRNLRAISSRPDDWDDDIKRLVGELVKHPVLDALHERTTSPKGIRRLEQLIAGNMAVHDAVVHSQDEIRSTDREIGELKLLKDVHDALHTVEHECLVPLRTDTSDELLFQVQLNFAAPASIIRAAARTHGQAFPLLGVLVKRLDVADAKLAGAVGGGGEAARHAVIEELEGITSRYPDQFQDLIGTATTRLRLDALVELMTTVRRALPDSAARDPELDPLLDAIDELNRMRDRLTRLVLEHGCLQSLDMTLRYVCNGLERERRGPSSDRLEEVTQEWQQIEWQRERLEAPFSRELLDARVDILAVPESRIRAAIEAGDADASIKLVRMYFQAVGTVFWTLDASLKKFCAELDAKSKQMKMVLSQTEVRHE